MAEENNKETNQESGEHGRLYEVAFHLLPTLSEDEVANEIKEITAVIEKHQGVVKNVFHPQIKELAYDITKIIDSKKNHFGTAYFGHLVCEVDREAIFHIRKEIEVKPSVLRALIVEISPESLLPRERQVREAPKDEVKTDEAAKNDSIKMTEAELDKTIEALVIE